MEERRSILKIPGGEDIPVISFIGEPGPSCFISGGVHGDEINGIHLVNLVMASLRRKTLKGTVRFVPILNISGFREGTRKVPKDGLDLNRCFGKGGRSLSHRIAKGFLSGIVKDADFGIDCHDSGRNPVLLPHARVHIDDNRACVDGCTLDFGREFGTRIILERKGSPGMLAIESFKTLGIPILTIEAGGGFVLWEDYLADALQGIHNLLISKGMIKGKTVREKEQFLLEDIDRFSYHSDRQGMLHKEVSLGDHVHKGDTIAKVFDPVTAKASLVRASHCGFIFSLRFHDKIERGETICSILADRACRAHKTEADKEGVIRVSE